MQRGFDTSAIMGKLDGIGNGLCDGFYAQNTNLLNGVATLQQSLCSGFGNVTNAITTGGYDTRSAISDLGYNVQAGTNALSSQLANCCCQTQNAITGAVNTLSSDIANVNYNNATNFANLNYNLASQICDLKTAEATNTRDIIDSQRAGVGQILDYLTNEKINSLTVELAQAQGQLSQANQTNNIISALRSPVPIPAYVVQNPACCTNTCGCGSVM